MAGLYVHIPFCRDSCNYCDFHFSISTTGIRPMLKAINREIAAEKSFLDREGLSTIYFGGGTPSILQPADIAMLLDTIRSNYAIGTNPEITLEANPDDLSPQYLDALKNLGINRLSIGIQSFSDKDLVLMNRRHDARQARKSIESARKAGFDNYSLDLIYGLPGQSLEKWKKNLDIILEIKPPHLAAYHLSYEAGTVLDYRRRKNKLKPAGESTSIDQYKLLTLSMENGGYEHYEISNFALHGKISRHNSAYWKGEKYLGVGPSAHSYNGQSRRWNISKNASYIRGIANHQKVYEEEFLDAKSQLHDYLLTSLRTKWGADLTIILNEWGRKNHDHILANAEPYIYSGKMLNVQGKLILSGEGMFIADHIISELFI